MTKGKLFHLDAILSVVTDVVFTEDFNDIKRLLSYMTADSIQTVLMPHAVRECASYLAMEMSWLDDIDVSQIDRTNALAKLAEWVTEYGAYHTVYPILQEDHEIIDPTTAAKQMNADLKIFTINISPEEDSL